MRCKVLSSLAPAGAVVASQGSDIEARNRPPRTAAAHGERTSEKRSEARHETFRVLPGADPPSSSSVMRPSPKGSGKPPPPLRLMTKRCIGQPSHGRFRTLSGAALHGRAGLEPARTNRPYHFGDGGNRTLYTQITSLMLYPMSYIAIPRWSNRYRHAAVAGRSRAGQVSRTCSAVTRADEIGSA